MLIGEPPATAAQLLPGEIAEWIARWRAQGLTLAQARTQAILVHRDIGKIRGKRVADAWWQELRRQDGRFV